MDGSRSFRTKLVHIGRDLPAIAFLVGLRFIFFIRRIGCARSLEKEEDCSLVEPIDFTEFFYREQLRNEQ